MPMLHHLLLVCECPSFLLLMGHRFFIRSDDVNLVARQSMMMMMAKKITQRYRFRELMKSEIQIAKKLNFSSKRLDKDHAEVDHGK